MLNLRQPLEPLFIPPAESGDKTFQCFGIEKDCRDFCDKLADNNKSVVDRAGCQNMTLLPTDDNRNPALKNGNPGLTTPLLSSSSSSTKLGASATPFDATSSQNTIDISQPGSDSPPAKKPQIAPIVGGVIGGVFGLSLLIGLLIFFLRRQRRANTHHESAPVLDKSRASSPTSHASPVYSAPPATTTWNPSSDHNLQSGVPLQETYIPNQQHAQQQGVPVLQPPEAPGAPASQIRAGPVELHSREVDVDGVSINSFDMERPSQPEVPRLPVYQRGSGGV
ncbi:hypothetical protein FPQ18DRAFT_302175 [Pyronema domesticum]|nr:hypothetical protein FPQ18DRAFT_302175 [Pyronema domesticum]